MRVLNRVGIKNNIRSGFTKRRSGFDWDPELFFAAIIFNKKISINYPGFKK